MKQKELTSLTDQELLQEGKKIKSTNITNSVLFGVMIGISIYSIVKNGFGLFTFFPLLFAPIAIATGKNYKALQKEIKSRNLK